MPTEFAFALRSTQNKSIFEKPEDHCHFVCVEKQERLFDWVLAMRLARVSFYLVVFFTLKIVVSF